jgi:two-component system cell cycle response regulator DivK
MPTILVVDDDEHIREFLRKSLSPTLTIVEAADGAQAVAAARWSHPQIVVMDLEMPVLDGFEAARQIKSDPTTGNPMLIALTGAQSENAVPRARAAGFSYFVHKDVDARGFVEKIVKLVREASGLPAVEEEPLPQAKVEAKAEPAEPQARAKAKPRKKAGAGSKRASRKSGRKAVR